MPEAPATRPSDRLLLVHLLPRLVDPRAFVGGVAVVIDNLRAGVTIAAALHAGATRVVPTLTIDDALAQRPRGVSPGPSASSPDVRSDEEAGRSRSRLVQEGPPPLLGGERGGVLIPGFDLDNSPASYGPGRLAGRELIFTTTNGTAALLHASRAERVLVGSLANITAVCRLVAADPRPVHLLCAGTGGLVSLDDCLPAGAMLDRLLAAGRTLAGDDSAQLCLHAWRSVSERPDNLLRAMLASHGGRNLERLGLARDVEFCSRLDTLPVTPEFRGGALVLSG
jgi:2-phosphosulfolactate phosphatase